MTGSTDYSELRVRLSDDQLSTLQDIIETLKDVPENVKASVENGRFIGIDEIKWLHENSKNTSWRLHEVLFDSELVLPQPIIPPRNPELEARVQKLKLELENKEYNEMTRNVDSVRIRHPEDSLGYQIRQMNKQLIAVLQFVFSVGAGFVFGFIGIELLIGSLEFGFRLLLGVICALIIALAEIYFLAKKLAEEFDTPLTRPPPLPQKAHQD